jgi:cysteine-rich repeat protein
MGMKTETVGITSTVNNGGSCPNSAINAGEQCDDNNSNNGDGCSSSC